MNRKPKKIYGLLTIIVALALATLVFIGERYTTSLSQTETAFVGDWYLVSLPDGELLAGLTGMQFASDRTFRSTDREFTGRWWISGGQFHLKCWRDEPTMVPFASVWRNLRAKTESWEMVFDENGDCAKPSHPENPTQSALVRVR